MRICAKTRASECSAVLVADIDSESEREARQPRAAYVLVDGVIVVDCGVAIFCSRSQLSSSSD